MDKVTQRQKILNYCDEYGSITVREAFEKLNINSPTKRISELKASGYDVSYIDVSKAKENGETVKFRRYFISGAVS